MTIMRLAGHPEYRAGGTTGSRRKVPLHRPVFGSNNTNPGRWTGVLMQVAWAFDQVGTAITLVGAVTLFDGSLMLVMSKE
jgi:hypothetical protein